MLALVWISSQRSFLLRTMLVCMLHETGHGIAMLCVRAGLREIRLCACGIRMQTHTALLTAPELLAVYLSGPAVNLLCAAVLRQPDPESALLHLCMGLFNLLPFSVLDGGCALRLVTEGHPRAEGCRKWCCILLAAGSIPLFGGIGIHNPALLLMLGYLACSELVQG